MFKTHRIVNKSGFFCYIWILTILLIIRPLRLYENKTAPIFSIAVFAQGANRTPGWRVVGNAYNGWAVDTVWHNVNINGWGESNAYFYAYSYIIGIYLFWFTQPFIRYYENVVSVLFERAKRSETYEIQRGPKKSQIRCYGRKLCTTQSYLEAQMCSKKSQICIYFCKWPLAEQGHIRDPQMIL